MTTKTTLKELLPNWTHSGDESLITTPEQEGAIETFTLGKYVSDDELEKEYASRGLVPAHPFLIAQYVKRRPDFKEQDLATHWQNEGWCFASFGRWDDERDVDVNRDDYDWYDDWWFAGFRKSSALGTSDTQALHSEPLPLDAAIAMVKEAGYVIYKPI